MAFGAELHSTGIAGGAQRGQDVGKAPLGLPLYGLPPEEGHAVDKEFFIVPVPVPLPVPELRSGNRRSYMDSDGRHPSFRGLLSDPVSGTGTGTRDTPERQSLVRSTP